MRKHWDPKIKDVWLEDLSKEQYFLMDGIFGHADETHQNPRASSSAHGLFRSKSKERKRFA